MSKRFSVLATMTISMHTIVEADNEEEAKDVALAQRGVMGLCANCTRNRAEEEWVTSGELDGEIDEDSIVEVVELDGDDDDDED